MPEIDLKSVAAATEANTKTLGAMTKQLGTITDALARRPAAGHGSPFAAPHYRRGEDTMTSRGFSFMKMMGLLTGGCTPEEATVEVDIHNRLHNVYCKELGTAGYDYRGQGHPGRHKFLAPLSTSFMQDSVVPRDFRLEMKSLVAAGCDGADLDEMRWMRQRQFKALGYGTKALSWLNELSGGALVAPPEQGELIELLRNKEALVNAGARVVPLPPQGRLKYPRQTVASNTFWVGESSPITDSTLGTGEVTLQAKKLAVLIKAPNELIRFASPAAEALMRDDMTKSLALGLDLAGLEGAGGDHRPRGILNNPFINTVKSSAATANGDKVKGEDAYRCIAAVEESNAEFEAWIMRPKTLYKYYQLRADAIAQGDAAGAFLFNLVREAQDGTPPKLAGYDVIKSTQVSQVRTKGGQSNLTYVIGGMWSDLLIGMFGAIEFAATTLGDTAFVNDQTWVRGILSADIAARHEAAFVLLDNLDTTAV